MAGVQTGTTLTNDTGTSAVDFTAGGGGTPTTASALQLHSPYSDQALGVFPPEWGSNLTPLQIIQKVGTLTPQQTETLQLALWKAGYYGANAIQANVQPTWGTMSASDIGALQGLLNDAATYQGGVMHSDGTFVKSQDGTTTRTVDELLQDRIRSSQPLFDQASAARSIADVPVQLDDPASIAESVRSTARSRLGRDLDPGELNNIVGPVSARADATAMANAQARVDSERAHQEALAGASSSRRNVEHAAPALVTGGMGGTASSFADALAKRFGVTVVQGLNGMTPQQTDDPDYQAGLKFSFAGPAENLKQLSDYLAGQQGDGKLVRDMDAFHGASSSQGTESHGPSQSPQQILDAYHLTIEHNDQGQANLTGSADDLKRFYSDAQKMLADPTQGTSDGLRYGINAVLGQVGSNVVVTAGAKGTEGAQPDQHPDLGGGNLIADAINAVGGVVHKSEQPRPDADGTVHLAAADAGARYREASDEAKASVNPAVTLTSSQTAPSASITATFRQGAAAPDPAGVGLFTGSDDSVQRFVAAVRTDDQSKWASTDGAQIGAYRMNPNVYHAIAQSLGLDPNDMTPGAQQRIASAYAKELYNRYGAWNSVAHAWMSGKAAVDAWNQLGDARNDTDADKQAGTTELDKRFGTGTSASIEATMLRMAHPDNASSPDVEAEIARQGAAAATVGGGNLIPMRNYDAGAEANQELERQHAPEMQAYGAAQAFNKFTRFVGSIGGHG